jgi:ABC-2 type transport system ATP-binding protein
MAEPVLRVKNLRKVYHSRRRGDVVAVDDVSFSVHKNEVVGLLGPNGAGKTTIIKSICTILLPTSGRSGWMG